MQRPSPPRHAWSHDGSDDGRTRPRDPGLSRGRGPAATAAAVALPLMLLLLAVALYTETPGLLQGAGPSLFARREAAHPAAADVAPSTEFESLKYQDEARKGEENAGRQPQLQRQQKKNDAAAAAAVAAAFRERLASAARQMERALADDDAMRVRRLAGLEKGGSYDAAPVADALVYPPGTPGGPKSTDEDDSIFRTTVESLLLAAEQEEKEGEATAKTYSVVLRGASVSAGDGVEDGEGRKALHQEQAVALLQSAFNHTPVDWELVDLAKGNTESSDSLATWNLFNASRPRAHVRLLLWEYLLNDERNLKKPPVFEQWLRTHLHWYPQADVGFLFVPGKEGPKPHAREGVDVRALPKGTEITWMDLACVSDLERTYGEVIAHYAPYAAQAAGHDGAGSPEPSSSLSSSSRRALFSASLGRYIEAVLGPTDDEEEEKERNVLNSNSSSSLSGGSVKKQEEPGRRWHFAHFYKTPPGNPHPGKLGYWAMGDLLAHHLKSRMRAALSYVDRAVIAASSNSNSNSISDIASLRATLWAAAGRGAREQGRRAATTTEKEEEDGESESRLLSLSPWLTFANGSSNDATTGSGRNAAGREGVPWFFPPPPAVGSETHHVMTNASYLARAVALHYPSPRARDIDGVTVECRRGDGTTTMEPGMVFALFDLVNQTGCANLEGVRLPPKRQPFRLDYDCTLAPPPCDAYPRQSFKLFVPFSFRRFGGFVLWPPQDLALYVNETLTPPAPDSPPVTPYWEFDPPLPGGVYLRMCVLAPSSDNSTASPTRVAVHKGLLFT